MNFQVADIAVGSLNSVIGILAAVNSRHGTGKGQFVDVAMLDGCVPFNSLDGAGFLVSGDMPKREGQLLNGGSAYDFYETKDGEYMSVGSLEPKFWKAFCNCCVWNRKSLNVTGFPSTMFIISANNGVRRALTPGLVTAYAHTNAMVLFRN